MALVLSRFTFVLLSVLVVVACSTPDSGSVPAVLSVDIVDGPRLVAVGSTLTLSATVESVGGASEAVTWSSSAPDVATIHATTGEATGNAGGVTTITATSTYDTNVRGTVTLTVPAPMILTIETDLRSTDTSVSLPLWGAVDVNIDWGDGTWTRATAGGDHSHVYGASGTYTIRIAGDLDQLGHGAPTWLDNRITRVTAWGDLGLISLSGALSNALLLSLPATLPPTVTDTSYMFLGTPFTADVSTWDVSNVTNMAGMFAGGENEARIDPDIGGWDVSNVTNMAGMFGNNPGFDRDIGGWDVSSVTDMRGMFASSRFDRDISGWDVSKVTNMAGMFAADGYLQTRFNYDIGGWDVSRVLDMGEMFKYNAHFNQNLADWCVVNIPTEPPDFALGADSWVLPQPSWGTCARH